MEWSPEFTKFILSLLAINTEKRLNSLAMVKKTKLMANLKLNHLMNQKLPPPFIPKQEALNCDPTYELEEMIVEAKPLHKKGPSINYVGKILPIFDPPPSSSVGKFTS